MRWGTVLAFLALRRLLAFSPQLTSPTGVCVGKDEPFVPSLSANLDEALDRAWLGVEIILAGEHLQDALASSGLTDNDLANRAVRCLIEATPADPVEADGPETRRRCWRALLEARQAGALAADQPLARIVERAGQDLAAEPEALAEHEQRVLDRLIHDCRAHGSSDLRPLLELRWYAREPFLVVLLAALLQPDLAPEQEALPGLHYDGTASGLCTMFEELRAGPAEMLRRYGEELSHLLNRLRPARAQAQAQSAQDEGTAAELQAARTHLRRGEHDRAIALFTGILAGRPDHLAALVHRAEAFRQKGDYLSALASLDVARQLAADDPAVLFPRAVVLGFLGRGAEAIDDYSAVLRHDPEHALAYTQRGSAYLQTGQIEEALADLTQALKLDPSSALAYQLRGDLFVLQGRIDHAIADYTQVIRRTPHCAATYLKRGDAYLAKEEPDRAIADFSSALRLDPFHVAGLLRRASAYLQQGQKELALADLNAAARLDPENDHIFYQRGTTHRSLGDYAAAIADFERALQIHYSGEVLYERGRTWEMRGAIEQALQDYNAAIDQESTSALFYRARGSLLVRQGQVDDGIADFTAAIHLNDRLAQPFLDRAEAWLAKGRFDKAIRDCDHALQRDPDLIEAYLRRGEAHAQQGDYAAADGDFTQALKLGPRSPLAYQVRAQVAISQGEYEKALRDLTRSLELSPDNAVTRRLRGTVHQALDQQEAALADLNQAMLLDRRYTPDYCNQRAFLHASRGDYEQALADYAIVLQLDPANVTALAGREQAQATLQVLLQQRQHAAANGKSAEAAKAQTPVRKRAKTKRPAAQVNAPEEKPPVAPPTLTHKLGVETQPQIDLGGSDSGTSWGPSTAGGAPTSGSEVENLREVPTQESTFLPDEAVAAPAPAAPTLPLQPPEPVVNDRPVGPLEALAAKEDRRRELEDRARQWEEMRHRERMAVHDQDYSSPAAVYSEPRTWPKVLLMAVLVAAVIAGIGYGGYYLFSQREPRFAAQELWNLYEINPDGANKTYKARFIRVTGTVRIFKNGQSVQFFFETDDPKWGIGFNPLGDDRNKLQNGQTITVRGRVPPRSKPDTNLLLTNCVVLQEEK